MRQFIDIIESSSATATEIPRVWISNTGEEVIECDENTSHHEVVVSNPEIFGITPDQQKHFYNLDEFYPEDGDETPPILFDVVIATAQTNGWTRISRDAVGKNVGISSSDLKGIRRAVRWLLSQNMVGLGVEFELEYVDNGEYYHISHGTIPIEHVALFAKTGTIPRKRV